MAAKGRKFKLDRYIELVSRVPLVPIVSEAALDGAIAFMDELLDRDRTLEEEMYLDVLSDLVEKYETEAYPAAPVSDSEMLASILDSSGLTQSALARRVGIAESTISAVLNGSRKLTRAQIGKIAESFNIPAGVFDFSS